MAKVHFRVPVTLDVSVSVGNDDATASQSKKWRPWPKDAHETMVRGEWLLVRFLLNGETTYSFEVAYFDGWNLVNGISQALFLPKGCTRDDFEEDALDRFVHLENKPEDLVWIPLVDILTEIEG